MHAWLSRDTDPLGLPFDGFLDLSWSLFSIVEKPSICFIAFVWTSRLIALSIIASIRCFDPDVIFDRFIREQNQSRVTNKVFDRARTPCRWQQI